MQLNEGMGLSNQLVKMAGKLSTNTKKISRILSSCNFMKGKHELILIPIKLVSF